MTLRLHAVAAERHMGPRHLSRASQSIDKQCFPDADCSSLAHYQKDFDAYEKKEKIFL